MKGERHMHYIKFNKRQVMPIFRHCARQNENYSNENIDPARTHLNYNLAPPGDQWGRMQDRLKQLTYREQKNNIVLCGWVITAPANLPEEKQRQFFKIMYDFMSKKYGENNVVSSYVHLDESGPGHMHFLFVPATQDNKLSASKTTSRLIMQNIHEEAQQEIDKYFNHQYLLRADNPEDRAKGSVPVETMKKALAVLDDEVKEQHQAIDNLEVEKELLDFDLSSQRSKLNYEKNKAKQELEILSSKASQLVSENERLQSMKNKAIDEQITLITQNKQLKKKNDELTSELSGLKKIIIELGKKCDQLKEFIERNMKTIRDWRDQASEKITIADKKINEYFSLANDFEQTQILEIQNAAMNALGEVPDGPDCDFELQPDPFGDFNIIDDEEWEL